MKTLVTGGCGFIGSHLVDRLIAEGHDVAVLDDLSAGKREHLNPKAKLTVGDVADAGTVQKLVDNSDAVFHLAAIASVQVCETQPELAARTNVMGAGVVFGAAAQKKIPVVYASSAAVYGDNPNLPLGETSATQPLGAYGKHKLINEMTASELTSRGLASIGLRFFNVYGPRQDAASPYSGVINKFMSNASAGKKLTFFGDGEQTRDFIYVGDIVELMMAAFKRVRGSEIFNGCTGKAVSLKQLATLIGKIVGGRPVFEHAAARTGDIRHSLGDAGKARTILNFNAATPLEDGLTQLHAWGASVG